MDRLAPAEYLEHYRNAIRARIDPVSSSIEEGTLSKCGWSARSRDARSLGAAVCMVEAD